MIAMPPQVGGLFFLFLVLLVYVIVLRYIFASLSWRLRILASFNRFTRSLFGPVEAGGDDDEGLQHRLPPIYEAEAGPHAGSTAAPGPAPAPPAGGTVPPVAVRPPATTVQPASAVDGGEAGAGTASLQRAREVSARAGEGHAVDRPPRSWRSRLFGWVAMPRYMPVRDTDHDAVGGGGGGGGGARAPRAAVQGGGASAGERYVTLSVRQMEALKYFRGSIVLYITVAVLVRDGIMMPGLACVRNGVRAPVSVRRWTCGAR